MIQFTLRFKGKANVNSENLKNFQNCSQERPGKHGPEPLDQTDDSS